MKVINVKTGEDATRQAIDIIKKSLLEAGFTMRFEDNFESISGNLFINKTK
tara:strand:- start:1665 stop:1817 length:153 start_codon:yes stop_codon:yes gene_type:complete